MEIKEINIKNIVFKTLEEYIQENDLNLDKVDENTRLIGASSFLDSMDLVNFIVELEERVNDEFSSDLELTDEKAMSRRTSPFMNIQTLVSYIVESLNDE
ncbi:hypothetical protein [Aquimarina algiphila]|uniref:hypothetical protein n=1 Tax=Aquimarina algiphila TaxID=2047982 RepID=UPI00232C36E1|nr:hypothetical protein [Aquimarina algiphila]